MRLERIDIDGFGLFRDVAIPDLPPGLSVFYGANEAGKSTLLAFIRYILFGFPDGRSKENPYPPIRGGLPGGRLTLVSKKGERCVVERRPGARGGLVKVVLPGGVGDGNALGQLLGFATRDLFRNIFAFSLAELQQFGSLDDEAVKTTIYSAGLGTGGVSLPEVQKNLDKTLQELFTPRSKSARINLLVDDLERVRQQLRDKVPNVEAYDELHGQLTALENEILNLQDKRRQVQQQHEQSKRFFLGWEDWCKLRAAERELAHLPSIDSFPVDGLARLQGAQERLAEISGQIGNLEASLRNDQEEHRRIAVEEKVLAQRERIDRLKKGRDRYDTALEEVEALKQQVKVAEGGVVEGLRELGPQWDAAKLEAFDASISQQEVIRHQRDEIRAAETSVQDGQNRLNSAAKTVEEAFSAEQQAKEASAAFPPTLERDRNVLAVRLKKLGQLASRLHEKQDLGQKLNYLQEREADLQIQKSLAQQTPSDGGRSLALWPALAIFGLLLVFGVFAAILAQGLRGLLVLIFSSFIAAAAAALYLIVRHQSLSAKPGGSAKVQPQLQAVEQRLSEITAEKFATTRRLEELEGPLRQLCAELNLDYGVDEATVAEKIGDAQRAEVTQQRWADAQAAYSRAAARLEAVRRDAQKEEEASRRAQEALTRVKKSWANWLTAQGLQENLTPEGALEVFAAIRACREKVKSVKGLQERLAGESAFVEQYRREVCQVVADCGGSQATAQNAALDLDRLAQRLTSALADQQHREELGRSLAKQGEQLDQLRQQQQALEGQLETLLAEGGATSAEEFRERAAIWQQQGELQRTIRQSEATLELIAGQGEHLSAFKEYLSQATPAEQQTIKDEAEAALVSLEQDLADKNKQRGAVLQQLQEMESEDETARLRMEEQALLARLQAEARKWSVTALAKYLLTGARERYERERQPGVVRDASQFFARITGGEYPQILALPEESTLRVIDKNQQSKEMDQLSTGTKEQLYFAVRLGLIREFSQRQEPLPVVMDDVFVNFDPQRAEAALLAVLELAQTNQVLLFTCHPETCELVRKATPNSTSFEM